MNKNTAIGLLKFAHGTSPDSIEDGEVFDLIPDSLGRLELDLNLLRPSNPSRGQNEGAEFNHRCSTPEISHVVQRRDPDERVKCVQTLN